jgi:hypothetical protein
VTQGLAHMMGSWVAPCCGDSRIPRLYELHVRRSLFSAACKLVGWSMEPDGQAGLFL